MPRRKNGGKTETSSRNSIAAEAAREMAEAKLLVEQLRQQQEQAREQLLLAKRDSQNAQNR
jgi:hypothetical protein